MNLPFSHYLVSFVLMKMRLLITLFALTGICSAQTQKQYNSAELLQSLKKLNTVGSVLYVAAHPDDENTRLLGYLANEKKLRTGYLSLTRGDGGQNLIGKEQGELLGLIRTNELLAARRTDGAEQFFTRANDFGFSKNPEETFGIWNKDSVLADVVWAIRKFKPDVIICRFPTTGEGGHGHHTASAILAQEAFDAAADPAKFPEQLKYVQVWKTKRLFWNTFNFGTTNTTAEDQLKIDVGVFNPLLGKYYGEIAADSRSMHKSQGFGSAKGRGTSLEYFKFLKGDSAKKDVFEGIDQSWKRFKETEKIGALVEACLNKYNPLLPENSVKDLLVIYKELQKLNSANTDVQYWKQQKLIETENLLLACGGLWAEAYASDYMGIPGKPVNITAQAVVKNNTVIKLNSVSFLQDDSTTALTMKMNELYTFKHKTNLPAALSYSDPYWLKDAHSPALYTVTDQLLRGTPDNQPKAKVVYTITIGDLNLKIERPLTYKYTDPVKGEIYRPFEVLPPATVSVSEKVFVFSDTKAKDVYLLVKANTANVSGTVQLNAPAGWVITIKDPQFNLANKGDEISIPAQVIPSPNAQKGQLKASIKIGEELFSKSIQRIEYDHIPYQFILSDAKAELVPLDLKKTGTNIAYIPGAGDDVEACLKQIGYTVTELNDDMLATADLSKYDAIVTGVRAYNTNERLQVHYNKLMEYVKNGGNLVVQYNTNSRVGPVVAKIGPYPFTVSRNRVTDEKAEVSFINENHPVLNFPNKISKADFDGWIQERGIYFATELDKNYETVFNMNDPGEKSQDGSLIVAKHGKGNFVYSGLVFFRELPAGVPGAYRLFVNLLSIPKNKETK
ncbi:MAG: LmbE family protein [Bacteroidetes bacterium]|nr:LmbE family protein [Bacteroidota bacterium]